MKLTKQAEKEEEAQAQVLTQMPQAQALEAQGLARCLDPNWIERF